MKIATKIKDVDFGVGPGCKQTLYRCEPPMCSYDYVIVSALAEAFDTNRPETFIFGADVMGEIVNYSELPGSYRGGMDHVKALRDAGYQIASEA